MVQNPKHQYFQDLTKYVPAVARALERTEITVKFRSRFDRFARKQANGPGGYSEPHGGCVHIHVAPDAKERGLSKYLQTLVHESLHALYYNKSYKVGKREMSPPDTSLPERYLKTAESLAKQGINPGHVNIYVMASRVLHGELKRRKRS